MVRGVKNLAESTRLVCKCLFFVAVHVVAVHVVRGVKNLAESTRLVCKLFIFRGSSRGGGSRGARGKKSCGKYSLSL